ncbi:hypothetical protein [Methylobacterium platani]|uniref:DUF4154 domain-containing protein n=3 Tax=Methylobacterium platani TaxID=427683 RepID=A0A179SAD6_9HYPH|nr:hypothetical protein [Methylobacterium platani]KMO18409.1 hypothetical protein SQ03_10470 [Methylobacterium platani JCM 14648]OAS23005.1 hypothetical protein A5481_17840 [Methylobacterium platani]
MMSIRAMFKGRPVGVALALPLCCLFQAAGAGGLPPPSRQDLQILGRILSFREAQGSGAAPIAIVYNPTDAQSLGEAQAFAELMGSGVAVGNLILRPLLIEQGRLGGASGYAAILTAAAVDTGIVRAAVRQHQIPCITRQIEQVAHGACTVGFRSNPSISIAYSSANAAAAGIRFATAFIMMVREV